MVRDGYELNWQVCSRARLSRDARFDGEVLHRRADQQGVLPLDLSGADGKRKECALLPDRSSRG
jgi:hypothetical protein